MKSRFGIFFQTVIYQSFQRGRDSLIVFGKVGGIFFQHGAHRLSSRFTVKGAPAGKHLVKNRAKRKDV
jgi:hypothetical protein